MMALSLTVVGVVLVAFRTAILFASVAIGFVCFAVAGRSLVTAARVWRTDPVPVAEAARRTGVDEFEGTVRPPTDEQVFDAPFSGRRAVLSTYTVERRDTSGESTDWNTVASGTIRRPFVVEDETGRVEVDPTGISVQPGDEPTEVSIGSGDYLPTDVRFRLSTLTADIDDFGSVITQGENGNSMRYSEGCITPGDDVHVFGTTTTNRTPRRRDVEAVVEDSPDAELFEITRGSEWTAVKTHLGKGALVAVVGLMFAGPSLLVLLVG